jgi:hypothetical protein
MTNHNNELNDSDLDELLKKTHLITKKHIEAVIQKAKDIEAKIKQIGLLAKLWEDISSINAILAAISENRSLNLHKPCSYIPRLQPCKNDPQKIITVFITSQSVDMIFH